MIYVPFNMYYVNIAARVNKYFGPEENIDFGLGNEEGYFDEVDGEDIHSEEGEIDKSDDEGEGCFVENEGILNER
jgi:hypothetical protein